MMPKEIMIPAAKGAHVCIKPRSNGNVCDKYNKTWAFFKGVEEFKKSVDEVEKQVESFKQKALKSNPDDFNLLKEECTQKTQERIKTEELIHKKLKHLREDVLKLAKALKDDAKSPSQALNKHAELIERLKVLLEVINEQETIIRHELCQEELRLEKELQALQKRFETWSLESTKYLTHASLQPLNLIPDVQKFEEFVQESGGHEQGWEPFEHQLFLKIRRKHKGHISFLKEAEERISIKTLEEIVNHEKWFREYLRLKELNMKAIREWRANKEKEKQFQMKNENDSKKNSDPNKIEQIEKSREEQREKIKEWKTQKEAEMEEKKEQERLKNLYDKRKLKKDREHQVEIHQKMEEYRTMMAKLKEKWQEEENQRRDQRKRQKGLEAKVGIKQTQSRDNQKLVAEREQREHKREMAKQQREERLLRIKRNLAFNQQVRDPKRLLNWTQAWLERKKNDERPIKTGFEPPQKLPHRAIPTWVKGIYNK